MLLQMNDEKQIYLDTDKVVSFYKSTQDLLETKYERHGGLLSCHPEIVGCSPVLVIETVGHRIALCYESDKLCSMDLNKLVKAKGETQC